MKTMLYSVLAVAFILTGTACDTSTTRGPSGKKLSLTQPSNQTLKRGEVNDVAISINRDNFDGTIKVKFEKLPKGVEVVEPKDIPAGQSRGVYTLHAANDADIVENYESAVTVEGPDGMAATEHFRISIKDK